LPLPFTMNSDHCADSERIDPPKAIKLGPLLDAYGRFIRAVESLVLSVCAVILVLMCVTLLLEISSRFFLQHSFVWAAEFATACFIWIAFLGATAGVLRKEHFTVDLLYKWFPPEHKVSLLLEMLGSALILLIGVIFFVYGLDLVESGMRRQSFSLGIKQGYIMAIMPISGALFALNSLHHLLVLAKGLGRQQ
jgi:TRAP-type C4-dicarboxylate transport system permease small subunit